MERKNDNMEAQPITDEGIKFQTLGELIEEAEAMGYKSEDQLIQYLHDCYIADENHFCGGFSEWLDFIDKGE